MKADIHPTWYPEARVTCACGNTWTTGATVPEIRTDVCSACHPFYTGEQRIVDTEGQVDRFMKRLQARQELLAAMQSQQAGALPMNRPLTDFELNPRATKALAADGIETVGDFLERLDDAGDEGLLAIAGFGRKGLIDVKRALRQAGYEIAGPEEA